MPMKARLVTAFTLLLCAVSIYAASAENPQNAPAPPAAIPSIAVLPVTGAPGDGASALPEAMARALSRQGLAVREDATGAGYSVQAEVETGQVPLAPMSIKITWRILDRWGIPLKKSVVRSNTAAAGALDGAWGSTADRLAQAAASEIAEIVKKQEASVTPAVPGQAAQIAQFLVRSGVPSQAAAPQTAETAKSQERVAVSPVVGARPILSPIMGDAAAPQMAEFLRNRPQGCTAAVSAAPGQVPPPRTAETAKNQDRIGVSPVAGGRPVLSPIMGDAAAPQMAEFLKNRSQECPAVPAAPAQAAAPPTAETVKNGP